MTSKEIDELMLDPHRYRNPDVMRKLLDEVHKECKHHWNIMEVCGGQTYALYHYGIEELLPHEIKLIHGPGCPVCVTPKSKIDMATEIARRSDVIFCSFGDMMRVPGSNGSLLDVKREGHDVRILYSPIDAISIARANPDRQIVFFAIGFETTMPIYAMMLRKIKDLNLTNISLLTSLYTVPPALYALSADPECKIDGILAAGHVCAVMGASQYETMANRIQKPIAITGFEPVDLLYGILVTIKALEQSDYRVFNPYHRIASNEGNTKALADISEVFVNGDIEWRGLGVIPMSGMVINERYEPYSSEKRFEKQQACTSDKDECISGSIMKGLKSPEDCPFFGSRCTPTHPIGAPMVSSEGVCSALLSTNKTL